MSSNDVIECITLVLALIAESCHHETLNTQSMNDTSYHGISPAMIALPYPDCGVLALGLLP